MEFLTFTEALLVAGIVAIGLVVAIAWDVVRRRRKEDDPPSE